MNTDSEPHIVDEYGKDFDYTFVITPKSARHPLTLAQLVTLIDTASFSEHPNYPPGLVVPNWDSSMEGEADPETQRGSIEVSSEFYPKLSAWYDDAFDAWCRRTSRELAQGGPAATAVN